MNILKFKCTLKTDVILNVKSATEGNNETLDFIPGNNFLGIAAGELYDQISQEEAMAIFHSGKVRFGDAHPIVTNMNIRSLRIPTSMYYPKMKQVTDECYIHHYFDRNVDIENRQLKQCRNGFYVFYNNEATPANVNKSFAIKSAYDREYRRSKDKAMYGYESLNKGTAFLFSIEVDEENLTDRIKDSLTGTKRIGRSRSAQYGLVEIEECAFDESNSYEKDGNYVTIYADSRIIFLDENGMVTFRPSVEQLGLKTGNICWEKSQIRTFQYAPWNYKRQCYDTDRYGIEKGSVFVIKNCVDTVFQSGYRGFYQNEGFGKIIFNPDFLRSVGNNSKALYQINPKQESKVDHQGVLEGDSLLTYLSLQKKKSSQETCVYQSVNDFVCNNGNWFIGKEKFASQWGAIRGIAMSTKDETKIIDFVLTYVGHGIKSDDWSGPRLNLLQTFMEDNKTNIRVALINLAAEMAKKCRNNGK